MSDYDGSQTLYKLNASQFDLYWIERLLKKTLEDRVYIMGTAFFDMSESFDADAMEQAYFEIMRRCDAFRIRVIRYHGKPRQFIQDISEIPVPVRKTLRSREELAPLIKNPDPPRISVFDEHLTEPVIYSCDDGSGGLILWQNHICTDGYSVSDIVYPQLCELYDCYRKGVEPPEQKKAFLFSSVLAEREKEKEKEKAKKDFKWWWKYYNHHLFRYSIPVRLVRETSNRPRASLYIDGERFERLNAFCRDKEENISENSFLMALLSLVVRAETRARRFSFNMQYHGRDTYLKKKAAGPVLLTLDPIFEPSDGDSLREYMRSVHANIMDTIVHARFSDCFKELFFVFLRPKTFYRDMQWLLVNYLRGYSTGADRPLELMGTAQVEYNEPVSFDMLDLEENGKVVPGVEVRLTMNGNLAGKERVEQLMRKYLRAMDFVMSDPERSVGECLDAIRNEK